MVSLLVRTSAFILTKKLTF